RDASPLLARLEERGYVYESAAAEEGAFRELARRFASGPGEAGARTHLVVCPTYSCNLRCPYCFERQSGTEFPRGSMDALDVACAFGAFDEIRERWPERRFDVCLFGGEPLLPGNRAAVAAVLEAAEIRSLPVSIISNGVRAADYLELLRAHAHNIDAVQVTIDGPPSVHDRRRPRAGGSGSFGAVAQSVSSLLENGIRVVARINIDRANVACLPELSSLAAERGWTASPLFCFSLASVRDHTGKGGAPDAAPDGELLELLLDVYDEHPGIEELLGFEGFQSLGPVASLLDPDTATSPRFINCEANYGGFWVAGPDGYLYPCPEAIGDPVMAVGRFLPRVQIWTARHEAWTGRNIETLPECRSCETGPLCGGGCTFSALVRAGSTMTPVCDLDIRGAMGALIRRRVITHSGKAAA
ncbi:MAG: radical SAM protein, partial [Pseudomonadota bacterium]